MPVTVRNTDILFNDGTTQSTAAGGAPAFGAVGTYTIASQSDITNMWNSTTYYAPNVNVAGSLLQTVPNNSNGDGRTSLDSIITDVTLRANAGLTGTWRRLTAARGRTDVAANNAGAAFLYTRVA